MAAWKEFCVAWAVVFQDTEITAPFTMQYLSLKMHTRIGSKS